MKLSRVQALNQNWWQQNPMTYDWQRTLKIEPHSREWFDEIDERFLSASYFARGADNTAFGRFMKPAELRDKDVLEIGCGMGTHASMLARCGARLTAIDLTEKAIATTRKRFELFGLKGDIRQADAERLAFPDTSFDFVWSWGVIHHSSSTETILDEITRVLRPGGKVMIMVYYRPSLVYYLHSGLIRGMLMGQLLKRSVREIYTAASDGFYARVFTKRELRRMFESAFSDIRVSVVGLKPELYPIPRNRFKEWLERRTPDAVASAILGRLGSMVIVEAQKRTN